MDRRAASVNFSSEAQAAEPNLSLEVMSLVPVFSAVAIPTPSRSTTTLVVRTVLVESFKTRRSRPLGGIDGLKTAVGPSKWHCWTTDGSLGAIDELPWDVSVFYVRLTLAS
jgi:hypothetical protein